MDYAAAFTYITQDEEWIKKLAIASVLALLSPLLGITLLPLMGWMLEITRRVAAGEQDVLPAWDEFGSYFAGGLKMLVLLFVWGLPIGLLAGCLAAIGAIARAQMPDPDDAALTLLIVNICIIVAVFPYALLLGILSPAAFGILGATGELGTAINPANALKLVRANAGAYIVVWLINGFVPSILTSIGSIVCGFGAAVGIGYSFALLGHLFGQAYRTSDSGAAQVDAAAAA